MTINANQQQTTEVVCIKCDGSGIYTSPRGTTGKCFTCQGTGMQQPKADPMIRTNQGRQMVGNIPVSDRMRSDVLKAMIAIIEGKGERTKMTRVYDIRDYLKQVRNLEVSNEGISATLDSLINNKYVRFFKNDENYYFFGISAFGWHKWDTRKTLTQPPTPPIPDEDPYIPEYSFHPNMDETVELPPTPRKGSGRAR